MAKRSKKQDKAERSLEDARARLAVLQEKYAKVQQKGRQQIERATQQAEEKLARVAHQVDRQAARVARAEERVLALSKPKTPQAAADPIEHAVAEQVPEQPETPEAAAGVVENTIAEQAGEQPESPIELPDDAPREPPSD